MLKGYAGGMLGKKGLDLLGRRIFSFMTPFELFPFIVSILDALIPVAETFVWLWRFPMG